MFENPRRGRLARNFTTNVSKILELKSSSEQIFFRKLPLGVPVLSFVETFLTSLLLILFHFIQASCVMVTPLQDYKFLNKGCEIIKGFGVYPLSLWDTLDTLQRVQNVDIIYRLVFSAVALASSRSLIFKWPIHPCDQVFHYLFVLINIEIVTVQVSNIIRVFTQNKGFLHNQEIFLLKTNEVILHGKQTKITDFVLWWQFSGCSNVGQHYPPDKSLPSGRAIGFLNINPLDSDLSGGQLYPTFEQPGPVIRKEFNQCSTKPFPTSHA